VQRPAESIGEEYVDSHGTGGVMRVRDNAGREGEVQQREQQDNSLPVEEVVLQGEPASQDGADSIGRKELG
jgi:hypothetical protein